MKKFTHIWKLIISVGPLIFGTLLLLYGVLFFWYDNARLAYVPTSFSYSADLEMTDTYYDSDLQRYSGARYSHAVYYAKPLTREGLYRTVETAFSATAIDGTPVASVTRNYNINVRSGQHFKESTDNGAASYLFAPRNLQKGAGFTFWDPLYKAPAFMEYHGEETLFGLPVYHYTTEFRDAASIVQNDVWRADAPAGQSLEYAPHLEVWIEPTSGWLVKSSSDTTVYRYDAATGERLEPFNHFVAAYTDDSVRQQADYAKDLNYRLTFSRKTAPLIILTLLLVLGLLMVLSWFRVRSVSIRATAGVLVLVPAILLGAWALDIQSIVAPFSGTGINPLVCVLFMLSGSCLFLIYLGRYKPVATGLAVSILGLAFLGSLGSTNVLSWHVDLLLFRNTVLEVSKVTPSRMSLVGALLFILLATIYLKILLAKKRSTLEFASFLAGILVWSGVAALAAKLLLVDTSFTVATLPLLSPITAGLFVLAGYGVVRLLRQQLHHSEHPSMPLRLWVRPALFTLPLVVISMTAQLQQNILNEQLQANFDRDAKLVQTTLTNTIDVHAGVLLGGRGLFAASGDITAEQWRTYIQALDLPTQTGLEGIGYIEVFGKQQAASFAARHQHDPTAFTLFPAGDRPLYTTVSLIEPHSKDNERTLGYDMFTDAIRGEAMERARDSGKPSLSKTVTLLTETGKPTEQGFLLFVPVYKKSLPTSTVSERRAALQGYLYSPFRSDLFLDKTLTDLSSLGVSIYDGNQPTSDTLFYNKAVTSDAAHLTKTDTTYLANHPWTIRYTTPTSFRLSSTEQRLPTVMLIGGSIVYLFLLLLFYSIHTLRRQLRPDASNAPIRHERR